MDNTNLNSVGSQYAAQYGHGTTDMIAKVFAGRKKIKNAAPRQYYVEAMFKRRKKK